MKPDIVEYVLYMSMHLNCDQLVSYRALTPGGTPIYGVTGCAALKGMFFDLPVSEWVCIFTEFEPRVSQRVCIFDGFDPKVSERVCILTLS